jgi:hypothetical protein
MFFHLGIGASVHWTALLDVQVRSLRSCGSTVLSLYPGMYATIDNCSTWLTVRAAIYQHRLVSRHATFRKAI